MTIPTRPDRTPQRGNPGEQPQPVRDPEPISPFPPNIDDPSRAPQMPVRVDPGGPDLNNHQLRRTKFQ